MAGFFPLGPFTFFADMLICCEGVERGGRRGEMRRSLCGFQGPRTAILERCVSDLYDLGDAIDRE